MSAGKIEGPIICPGHSRPVPDLQCTDQVEDGYFIISSCLDGKAMLRDGKTGDWIGTFLGHKGAVWCARLNADATRACTGSADFTAKLWNAVTGDEMHSFSHKHIVKSVLFSADSKRMFTAGYEKKIRVFDLNRPDAAPQIIEGHTSPISHTVRHPDPNLLLSCGSGEDVIRVWDIRSGEQARTIQAAANLTSMSLTTSEKTICTTAGKTAAFFDAEKLELIKSFDDAEYPLCSVAYHEETGKYLTGTMQELWVWAHDFNTGELITVNKGHHGPVRCLAFPPDGSKYISGSEDGTIRIWNWAKTGGEEAKAPKGEEKAD